MQPNKVVLVAVLLPLFGAGPGTAWQAQLESAQTLAVGCSTCFPKPAGVVDAFDAAEVEAILNEGQALVVLAHDTELANDSYELALQIKENFPVYGSQSRTNVTKTQLRG